MLRRLACDWERKAGGRRSKLVGPRFTTVPQRLLPTACERRGGNADPKLPADERNGFGVLLSRFSLHWCSPSGPVSPILTYANCEAIFAHSISEGACLHLYAVHIPCTSLL